ncbi:MAG: 3,4-dihydroxy-2-butanone-4-phosphate synthase, partial [Thermoplasmata archaeon]|nr:3,4-dihydroxy-2-butanone-4-phosphate synthase [Thermoplasmata archaeon]
GLPYAADLLRVGQEEYPVLGLLRLQQLRYDSRSAFGITVNHRTNFTGVPDNDRATTIGALGRIARDSATQNSDDLKERFVAEFTSPGHLPVLYAAPGLVAERKGHTEFAISLARMARLSESVTVCEMLGDSGGPRSPDAARRYAEEHGWPFLEGRTITEAWIQWSA